MKAILKTLQRAITDSTPTEKAAAGAVALGVPAGIVATDVAESTQALDLSKTTEPVLASKILKAQEAGYTLNEVEQFLTNSKANPYQKHWAMRNAVRPQVEQARAAGYTDDEIYAYLDQQGLGYAAPKLPAEVAAQYQNTADLEGLVDVNPIAYHPDVVNAGMTEGDLYKIKGNPEELVRAANTISSRAMLDLYHRYITPDNAYLNQVREEANAQAKDALHKAGFKDVEIDKWGEIRVVDPKTGEWTTYENPWYIDLGLGLRDSAGEIVAGTGGAYLASMIPQGRVAKAGAALVGGSLSVALGRSYDVLRAASTLNTQLSAKELALHMGDAAAMETVAVLGIGALGQLSSYGLKGVSMIYDRFIEGNRAGAFEAAKAYTNLNDAQIIDLLDRWEAVTGTQVRSQQSRLTGQLTNEDKGAALQVLGQTTPGMENSIQAALNMTRTGGASLAKTVSDRAKALETELDNLTNDNVVTFVTEGLNTYNKQVTEYYGLVKDIGIEQANAAGFRFSFETIKPLQTYLEKLHAQISNYGIRNELGIDIENLSRVGNQHVKEMLSREFEMSEPSPGMFMGKLKGSDGEAQRISPDLIDSLNPVRTFADLLELRKTVNRLASKTSYKQFYENNKIFETTMKSIDDEIERGALMMENGEEWLKSWKQANAEYHKMKELNNNSLYKALTKPTVNTERAVKAFAESLTYEGPDTYMSVMAALPPKTRRSVEGAVVKHLVEKNTIRLSDEVQAIDFPKLHQQLETMALTNDEARHVKRMIKEMAALYRNDVDLVQVAWAAPAATPRNNIATSLTGKMKMQFATKAFHLWQALAPFRSSDMLALTLQMRKVIDNPLDAKAVEHLKNSLGNDPELETFLHRYAIEYAKFGQPKDYGRATLYRVAEPGNADKAADTSLGHGVLTYSDPEKAKAVAKELGLKVTPRDVPIKAIARPSDVEALLGRPATPEDLKSKLVQDKLRSHYLGYTEGDKTILFK